MTLNIVLVTFHYILCFKISITSCHIRCKDAGKCKYFAHMEALTIAQKGDCYLLDGKASTDAPKGDGEVEMMYVTEMINVSYQITDDTFLFSWTFNSGQLSTDKIMSIEASNM